MHSFNSLFKSVINTMLTSGELIRNLRLHLGLRRLGFKAKCVYITIYKRT